MQGRRRERAHRTPLPEPLPEQVPELCTHEAPGVRDRVDSGCRRRARAANASCSKSCSEPHARRAVRARA